MSELISGKEALIALANGEEVEYFDDKSNEWVYMDMTHHFKRNFHLKQKTIILNGIEVPVPFDPKSGDMVWCLSELSEKGYEARTAYSSDDFTAHIAYWKTESEIKQVVAALRTIFKGDTNE